ncbi:MAG: efflux RND transporter periplasmic adaptor subunit, partial [Verrucomicrobiae bacterium]|nr:efflux RND transporter periplasmic adaptor subunit [Verrucomicrobiae bacterium]
MKSGHKWRVWALLVVLAGGAGYTLYKRGRTGPDPAQEYRTALVTRGTIVQAVTANGQINPVKSVQVGSQVSGIIQSIFVDFNSPVTNGQVIAQIDPSTFKQNLSQAEAELANAEAALELAQLNHRRAQELHKNQLITQADYDKTVVDLHQAEAAKKMREAAVERARVELSRTTITAPVNGIVISRNVDVGQTVAASFNTPTLFLIAHDLTKMQIEAMVSEADVGGVEEGQRVEFTVDAFPTRKFEGFVKQVRYAPITNQNVVNYVTVVDVDNPDLKLRPGMTANASIITAKRDNVLRVPTSAFLFRPKQTGPAGQTNLVSGGLASVPSQTNTLRTTNQTSAAVAGSASPPTPPWVAEGRPPSG